jgi:uncharacterized protein YjiK
VLAASTGVSRLRMICAALVTSGACATAMDVEIEPFIDNSKADGHSIKLHLHDRHKLDVEEPSDLAILDGHLYTVSDKRSKIYRISHDGDIKEEIDVEGTDIEAIAFDPDGRLFFADESSGKIWRVDDDGDRKDPIEVVDDEVGGLEGLAFDDKGHLWAAKEKNPARIYELDTDGGQLDRKKVEFADDLSALAFDPEDGRLYALSDQERTLFRLDKDLDVDKAWKLPIDHPEGIAFEGDTLYVVSDSEERLYVFEIERR